MPESLPGLLLGVVGLVVVYVVMRVAAKIERRAARRRLMELVYYPGRGRNSDLPVLIRRKGPPRSDGGAPTAQWLEGEGDSRTTLNG